MGVVIQNLNIKQPSGHTFSDLHLDIETDSSNYGGPNTATNVISNDIKVSLDEAAIGNSLTNLFAANHGDFVLVPKYGANLSKFLFEGISKARGEAIGKHIHQQIDRWEPRVAVERIVVKGNLDRQEYEIAILLTIPALNNRETQFLGSLSRSHGITFLPIVPRA